MRSLLLQRWTDAHQRLGLRPGQLRLEWEINDNYPHFAKKRGYAVCFFDGKRSCRLQFSSKMLKASPHRADAIVRHELGHVLDFLLPKKELDRWAASRGVKLPHTPERRADALALAIWGTPIRYDNEFVQSTSHGVPVRPEQLGL